MKSREPYQSEISADIGSSFYDAILSSNVDETDELRDSEYQVYEQISEMLESTEEVTAYVPVLPEQLIAILNKIYQQNTDFEAVCQIVKTDIALAGETIRIANSPMYRRSSGEIDSIERAVACLGLQGVSAIASLLLVRDVINVESKRFKEFGRRVWNHSLECAEACRLLAPEGQDPFTCYLLGLVHDAGKVVMLACLGDYFVKNPAEDVDEEKLYKMALSDHSTWLSAKIAEEWNLPAEIVTALREFDVMTVTEQMDYDHVEKQPLAKLLKTANECSEIHTLIETGKVSQERGVVLLNDIGMDKKNINSILDRYQLLMIGSDLKE